MENNIAYIPTNENLSEILFPSKNTLGGSFRCRLNPDLSVIDAKESFYLFIGYTKGEFEDLFSAKISRIIHPDDLIQLNFSIENQLNNGDTIVSENRLICKDGTIKWILFDAELIKSEDKSPYLHCIFIDITKFSYVDGSTFNKPYGAQIGEHCYKASEGLDAACENCYLEEISTNKNSVVVKENGNRKCNDITRFRTDTMLFNLLDGSIPGGILSGYFEDGFPFYFINQHMLDYLGYESRNSFIKDIDGFIINCVHPIEKDSVKKSIIEQFEEGNECEIFYRMRKKDGSYIQIFSKCQKILAENGKPVLISVCLDISKQKDLQKQISLYRAAERGGVFTVKLDKHLTLVYANDIFYQIHGHTPQSMLEENLNRCANTIVPEELETIQKMLSDSIEEGKDNLEWEMRIVTRSGVIRHVLVTAAFSDLNEERVMDGLIIDITQQYKLKDKISKSEERYKIALEYANINIWEYNIKTQALTACGLIRRFSALPDIIKNIPETLIEMGDVHPDSVEDYRKFYKQILSGNQQHGFADIRFKSKCENRYWWERITYTIIFNKNGAPLRAIEIGEDVTLQKETEIKYQQELQIRQESMRDLIASSKVNLTKNKIEFMQVLGREFNYQNLTYNNMFNIGINTIMNPSDKERYIAKMSPPAIFEAYQRGEKVISIEYRRKDVSGQIIWVLATTNLVVDAVSGDLYAYGTIRNINEQKNIEFSLRQRAERDFVTGAYNYETSYIMMEESLEKSRKNDEAYCLFLFSIDNFTALLDSKNHIPEDTLVCELYILLQSSFGNKKIIGRLGSEIFAVCIRGNLSKEELSQEAKKIHGTFCTTYCLPNEEALLSLSIGYAFSQEDDCFSDIYSRAKSALGIAKSDYLDYCIEYDENITKNKNRLPHSLISSACNELDAVLLKCAFSIVSGKKIEQVINSILQTVAEYYRAEQVSVLETSYLNFYNESSYEWIAPDSNIQSFVGIFPGEYETLLETICNEKSSPILDICILKKRFPYEYNSLYNRGIRSLCVTEINSGDGVIGYLIASNPKSHINNDNLLILIVNFISGELTKRCLSEKQLYLNNHDSLTGLFNRSSYLKYRETLLEESLISMGVASFDINGLKQMNSRYGYPYGDRVIQFTGKLLQEKLGNIGAVYRFSGDEFLAICENITKEAFVHFISEIKETSQRCFPNSLSIGYTWSDTDIDLTSLIEHADERMILSKQDYYRSLEIKTKRHDPAALKELFKALDDGLFTMYLQPKADIISEKVIGAEALVRIKHPKYGLIYPGKFIPRLEEDGNIRYVDFYMFEEVCKTVRNWIDNGIEPIVISLNFSRSTILTENLIDIVESTYDKYNVPKKYIEIEITESIGEIEKDSIAQIGRQIVQQGYRLSLDDFGARYSNISILSAMRLHVVKLDKSLVNDLTSNPSTRIVVGSFIQMCKKMGVESVAEGVETAEQLTILRDLECDLAQGYYFNKPIPLEDFEQKYLIK